MALTEREIGVRAESALREAGGEWEKAVEVLRRQVASDENLREGLLEKVILDELRKASSRLGESTKKCPFCSEVIALDASKCKFCGEWLQDSPFGPVPRPPARPPTSAPIIRHFTLLTSWVLIVLIVILIIAFAT